MFRFLSRYTILFSLLAFAGCSRVDDASRAQASNDVSATAREGTRAVSVVVVRPGMDAGDSRRTVLEPWIDAPVVARHKGIIRQVLVIEGRRVPKGAVLARLEDDEYRLDLERASALSSQADAEAARARKSAADNLISQHELEVAEAHARAMRADRDLARLECARCEMRAPIAGVVRLSRAEPDALVDEGEILFHVSETARLRASIYLNAAEFTPWATGGALIARITPLSTAAAPAQAGHVLIANPIADPVTGLHHVEIEVAPGPGLAPGAEVLVDLAASKKGGDSSTQAVLPRGAYLERNGNALAVYRVAQGRAERVVVQLGDARADGFPVLAGLAPGDLVLASGELPPAAGTPVQAKLSSVR
ncbi:MAG TPA: efflux RND transporter periplasmic adaptor subunit [Candidatus Eisenbacteria bacterium]|jgi:RND family efflux transporter MFP subunit|nr:efflux RND transporter periplasmic adaptor subunit [Candidatus Eisenbacteria bacterium]